MSNKETLILFTIFSMSFFAARTSSAEKQSDDDQTLSYFYKNELLRNSQSSIDTTQLMESDYFHEAKIEPQKGLKESDRIEKLPGQPEAELEQYGGYVMLDRAVGRAFYYYFVRGKSTKKTLPLLLWLNGGPGCSSLGSGAMQEVGPFRVCSDGKTLQENKFAWNKVANVLFLESPAGVGFSYSNTTADFTNGGDRHTAKDNYTFLLNWLYRFPEYKDTEFYISGESYAGHYGTMLAQTILHNNRKANKTLINLKGIIIGNPTLDDGADQRGMYEYYGGHGLVSDESIDKIFKHCEFPEIINEESDKCRDAREAVTANLVGTDIYNIYAPVCLNSSLTDKPKKISGRSVDPCIDAYVHAYLNRAEVQEALHANVTKLPYDWQICSLVIKKWTDSPTTVMPLIKDFLTNDLRVWIYSGDADGRIPFTSTKLCLQKIMHHPKSAYRPWYSGGQVGGYTQVYEGNLRFVTVRGAGHQVPSYQPARALSLIRHFLAGKDLPTSTD